MGFGMHYWDIDPSRAVILLQVRSYIFAFNLSTSYR